MNNVEREVLKNISSEELEKSKAGAEKIIKSATEPLITTGNMVIFSKKYPDDRRYNEHSVRNDIRYTQAKEAGFKNYDIIAHAVEYMVGNWLDSNGIFNNDTDSKNPRAARSSNYDDYAHGVDITKTWALSDEDANECKAKELTIAIDVTTSSKDDIIYKKGGFSKLSQMPNGLPYGFTSIKYYAEQDPSTNEISISNEKSCVPRFTVGIDRDIVSNMLRNNEVTGNLDQNTPKMVLTRFKILSEIYSQAALFIEKLPDEDEFNPHRSYLETILSHIEKPMIQCAESMIPYPIESGGFWAPTYKTEIEVLSSTEIEKIKRAYPKGTKGASAVAVIEQIIEDKDSSFYDATYTAIQNGVERFYDDNPEACPPKTR